MKSYLILGAMISIFLTNPVWALTSTEVSKLVASDGEGNDQFGYSVAIDGDTMVVGALCDDDQGSCSGSAYVFTRSEGTWTEQAKLLASEGQSGDQFGYAVAIDGDIVVIGALSEDNDQGRNAGSVYVFTRSGATWTEQAKLLASDGQSSDHFGYSVAIEGDTVVIGTYADTTSGSVYIFTRSGATWTEQEKLLASDGLVGDFFGHSVAIEGDTVVAGAFLDDDKGQNSGSAYVFIRSGTTWAQQQKLLASDGESGDYFGMSVGIDGSTLVVGTYADGDQGYYAGSAYIFTRSGTIWTEQQKLLASDGANKYYFGGSAAIDGDTVVIGAKGNSDLGSIAGSAYVFTRSGIIWTEQQKLLASDGESGDQMGFSVVIDGDTVVAGAYTDDDQAGNSGSAYIFSLPYNDADSDNDGIDNISDICMDTPPDEIVNYDGCSINQLCVYGNSNQYNQGKCISCVVTQSAKFVRSGLISNKERREIISEAVGSSCGI